MVKKREGKGKKKKKEKEIEKEEEPLLLLGFNDSTSHLFYKDFMGIYK